MPRNTQDILPTLFLDTNALVYLWSYITKARELQLPPFIQEPMEYENISSTLKSILPDSIAGFYIKGCQTLAYIQRQTERSDDGNIGIQIFTSRLSKVEMLNGALDGKAHILMAQQGIPYRMRQRSSNLSDLISMRLQRADVDEVVKNLNDIFVLLSENDNVNIDFVEDNHQADNIAHLAEFLSSHFYLDVIDIWMYSCALTVQADQIICFDDYFHRVINNLNNGTDKWVGLRKEISKYVKQLFGWNKVIFPKSSTIPKFVPQQWSLNVGID
jgi:hypothetical protein